MAVDETPSTGACGGQDAGPCGVGDAVSAENPRARDSGISQEGPPGSAGIPPPDWFLEEIGVERDHVHLQRVIPPKYAVSRVVETSKSVTSRQLKREMPARIEQSVLGGRRGLGTRGFRLHGGYQRSDHSAVCAGFFMFRRGRLCHLGCLMGG